MDWGLFTAIVMVIPFITILPALFFAGLAFGLYELIRDLIRERAAAGKKSGKGATGELDFQKVA
jgi:hypothetical protein